MYKGWCGFAYATTSTKVSSVESRTSDENALFEADAAFLSKIVLTQKISCFPDEVAGY